MDTLKNFTNFTNIAQDIHNRHFEQKINKDQEIAERRINEYFEGKLNLTWKTILREINKLNELSRNKYFDLLITKELNKQFELQKNATYRILLKDNEIITKWKILTTLFLSAFLVQTLILIITT